MYYNGQMNTNEAVRRLTQVVRRKHLALATERTYCAWLRRYCDFLKALPLHLPRQHKLERFLTVLAQKDVAASTQNQAFNAIISIVRAGPQRRHFWVVQPSISSGQRSSSSEPPHPAALRAGMCLACG
jgi:hypothetical protein